MCIPILSLGGSVSIVSYSRLLCDYEPSDGTFWSTSVDPVTALTHLQVQRLVHYLIRSHIEKEVKNKFMKENWACAQEGEVVWNKIPNLTSGPHLLSSHRWPVASRPVSPHPGTASTVRGPAAASDGLRAAAVNVSSLYFLCIHFQWSKCWSTGCHN